MVPERSWPPRVRWRRSKRALASASFHLDTSVLYDVLFQRILLLIPPSQENRREVEEGATPSLPVVHHTPQLEVFYEPPAPPLFKSCSRFLARAQRLGARNDGSGERARAMEHAAVSHADQPHPCGTPEQW